MSIPHNIERSAFRPGEYVGYLNGVWRIKRVAATNAQLGWVAIFQGKPKLAPLYGRTLKEIGLKLESYEVKT